jgi:hypothetical protein
MGQQVIQLCDLKIRIDGDQNGADFRRCKLRREPFRYVGCPYGHMISFFNSQLHQPFCGLPA